MSGSSSLTGSMGITDNLNVLGNISSSTINGIGNVTLYSQSVDQRLNSLQVASASLNVFSSSAIITASATLNTITFTKGNLSTFDITLAGVTFDSGGFVTTSSFNAYTSSVNVKFSNIETTTASLNISVSNLNSFSSSQLTQNTTLAQVTSSLISFTGSYATTGSNTFNGNQTINGTLLVSSSMVYSGSVRGQVFPITIASNTASMDCSKGNFFTISLPSGSTRLEATNILPGETLSLRILNSTSGSQLTGSAAVKFPTGFTYVPTAISASTDIITFLSFDNSAIFAVAANYFA
jgi:hypothetical protein